MVNMLQTATYILVFNFDNNIIINFILKNYFMRIHKRRWKHDEGG